MKIDCSELSIVELLRIEKRQTNKNLYYTGDTEADVKAPSEVGRSKRQADGPVVEGETAGGDGHKHKEEDVYYVSDTPRVQDGKLQVTVLVKEGEGLSDL